jgi:hypothetical protein
MKLLLAALLASALAVQDAPPQDPPKDPQADPQAEKLAAWPELSAPEKKQVETEIQKLVKARTPEMAASAEAALAGSAGAMPLLLAAYGKEKDDETRARLAQAMLGATDARHTRALAGEFTGKNALVRAWCLRRAAAFPDPGVRAAAEQAVLAVERARDKADPEERYAASLCSVAAGSLVGLDVLREWAGTAWAERRGELRTAVASVRGVEASALLAPGLGGERPEVVAALRLLSAAGDETVIPAVARHLDSDDNQVRVAAINALRGIVDGQEPLEELSVFGAIELAKTWKVRVGR